MNWSEFIEDLVAGACLIFSLIWFAILPTTGLLWIFGVLK